MGNNKLPLLLIPVVLFAVSCGTNSNTEQALEGAPPSAGTAARENTAQDEEVFDSHMVSQEYYDATKEEVQHFINDLNLIIRNRNYASWRAALSDEYFRQISSQENLQQVSQQPAMMTRRIVLRTAEDYFLYVVVPSRANSRVDDIEFVSRNRVKAFTVNINRNGEEQRLRLYDLEKIGNTWKIIN
jgi:hypothetical protein